ncbi:type II toxin-antitoxin system PemK/MazF family toxin [Candidatus Kaiserbacteria bacterium]|nr:type II toxin-antitoxin system PemK/MazF family toxin [Candidatus Kaiserbacteria bacterium]
MQKEFGPWNKKKKETHESARPGFKVREIWACKLGGNVGDEQDGVGNDFLRPIVVLKKFNNNILWGIPLTRTDKPNLPFYFSFFMMEGESTSTQKSIAILSQIRLIDARRLSYRIGEISQVDYKSLTQKLKDLIP